MKLINLEQYRAKEVVEALEALLAEAKAGNLHGLAYIVKITPDDTRAGTAGAYRKDPKKALEATYALERYLCSTGRFASSL